MLKLTNEALRILRRARKTYGKRNQIIVSIEECNELSAILAKFARYHEPATAVEKLKPNVIDEVSDVLIVLEHVKAIFGITDEDLCARMEKKIARLDKWLNTSNDIEQTTIDRKIPDSKDE